MTTDVKNNPQKIQGRPTQIIIEKNVVEKKWLHMLKITQQNKRGMLRERES